MTDNKAIDKSVDQRIEAFLVRKALKYPRLSLTEQDPETAVSAFRPFHEFLADQIVEMRVRALLQRPLAAIRVFSDSAFNRADYVK